MNLRICRTISGLGVLKFLIFMLTLAVIIDPADMLLKLKVPLFILTMIYGIIIKNNLSFSKTTVYVCFFFFIIPLISFLVFVSDPVDHRFSYAMAYIKSFAFIFLLLIIENHEIKIDRYINILLFVIVGLTLYSYITLKYFPALFEKFYIYTTDKQMTAFGQRHFFGITYASLFFSTSPLLVFPLSFYTYRFLFHNKKIRNLLLSLLVLITMVLSGTRANIFSGFLIVGLLFIYWLYIKISKLFILIIPIFLILVIPVVVSTLSINGIDQSNKIKLGHLNSYIELYEDHPLYLLTGQGIGGTFYSEGSRAVIEKTELTYLETIRLFGLPLSLFFYYLLCVPFFLFLRNIKYMPDKIYFFLAYFFYLVIAGTNPLLMSSTGFLVLVSVYSKVLIYMKQIRLFKFSFLSAKNIS